MSKLKGANGVSEIVANMMDGNLVEMGCLKGLLNYDYEKGLSAIGIMDKMEIYGVKIAMLFHFCCNDDYEELLNVLLNAEVGILTKEEISENLSTPYPEPFQNLLTNGQLVE